VIVRPFNNYGPCQHPEKVVPRFITQALAGEPLTIHGDGSASRDWLHVDDTATAIEALVDAPLEAVAGEVVNVATGVDLSVAEIARLVLAAVGTPDATIVHVDERPGQVARHIGSTDKLAALTGWRSAIDFEDGLERTVAWYRENEAWWRGVLGRDRVSSS
jgi:dTDP-glucose 4,6-dehydratase